MKETNNNTWTHIVIAQYSHDNEFNGSLAECEAWIDRVVACQGPRSRRNWFIIKKGE